MLHYVVTVFIYMFVMFYLQLLLFVFTYWFKKKNIGCSVHSKFNNYLL